MMLVSLTVFYALGASRTYFLAMFKMILPARIRTIFIVALEVFITPDTEAGIACAEKKLAQLLELSVLC